MEPMSSRVANLNRQLEEFALRYGREPDQLVLLAVSKTRSAEEIRRCYGLGQERFAENYLQEALEKIAHCADLPIEWHFIGRVQRNKTREIASRFDWVHTVDRELIARRLHEQRPDHLPPLNICIQVNLDRSESKAGVTQESLPALLESIRQMGRLSLRGLMTIPEPAVTLEQQRRPYRQLAGLFQQCAPAGEQWDTLSMGMSGDMEAAIAEGATLLRIGTALFGPRD